MIERSELDVEVEGDGLDDGALARAVDEANRACPVSNTLRRAGVELVVHARPGRRTSEAQR